MADIKVRLKATGQTGTIDSSEFDSNLFERQGGGFIQNLPTYMAGAAGAVQPLPFGAAAAGAISAPLGSIARDVLGQGSIPQPSPINQSASLSERLGKTASYGGQLLGGLAKEAGSGALTGVGGWGGRQFLSSFLPFLGGLTPGLGGKIREGLGGKLRSQLEATELAPMGEYKTKPASEIRGDITRGTKYMGTTSQPWIEEQAAALPKGKASTVDIYKRLKDVEIPGYDKNVSKSIKDPAKYLTKLYKGYIDEMAPEVNTTLKQLGLVRKGQASQKWAGGVAAGTAAAALIYNLVKGLFR